MSYQIIMAVWPQQLPPTEKLVLLAFADLSDRDGRTVATMDKIAEKCSLEIERCSVLIDALIARDLLERSPKPGLGWTYRVMVPKQQ